MAAVSLGLLSIFSALPNANADGINPVRVTWPSSATAPVNLGGTVDGIYTDAAGAKFDGAGYRVVVIDGAFDSRNSAFQAPNGKSKIPLEACFGQKTGTSWLTLCDTTNFVNRPLFGDPSAGYYFSSLPGSAAPSNAPTNQCSDPATGGFCHYFHGVATAGLVAGQPTIRNETGGQTKYSGVAPGASVIALKVGGGVGTQAGWPINSVVDALNYVVKALVPSTELKQNAQPPIAAVSISANGAPTDGEQDCAADSDGARINEIAGVLKSKGIAVVMAAGNNGANSTDSWVCGSNVIVVGATGVLQPTVLTTYTNVSRKVNLFAPVGTGNFESKDYILAPWAASGSFLVSGTSFAAPQVAGGFAVLRQKFGRAPSVDQLVSLMQKSGRKLSGLRSELASPNASVLNIKAALNTTP